MPFVDEEASGHVGPVDDVEGVDDVVEAEQGRRLNKFGVGDPARVEVSAGIQEAAARRRRLSIDLLDVSAQLMTEWDSEVLQRCLGSARLGKRH